MTTPRHFVNGQFRKFVAANDNPGSVFIARTVETAALLLKDTTDRRDRLRAFISAALRVADKYGTGNGCEDAAAEIFLCGADHAAKAEADREWLHSAPQDIISECNTANACFDDAEAFLRGAAMQAEA